MGAKSCCCGSFADDFRIVSEGWQRATQGHREGRRHLLITPANSSAAACRIGCSCERATHVSVLHNYDEVYKKGARRQLICFCSIRSILVVTALSLLRSDISVTIISSNSCILSQTSADVGVTHVVTFILYHLYSITVYIFQVKCLLA